MTCLGVRNSSLLWILSQQDFQSLTGMVKRQLSMSTRGRTSKPHLWRCFFIMSLKIIKWLNIRQMNVYSSVFAFWNSAFEALNFYHQHIKKWTWTHFLALGCSIISFLGPTHLILWFPALPLISQSKEVEDWTKITLFFPGLTQCVEDCTNITSFFPGLTQELLNQGSNRGTEATLQSNTIILWKFVKTS